MSTDTQKLKSLWQSLPSQTVVYSHEQMRERADRFQAKHKRRDAMEYLGFAGLIGLIGFYLMQRADWQALTASALAILGAMVMFWNFYRLAKVKTLPTSNSSQTTLDYMRSELTRQRDAAATAWKWYILPFVPFAIFSTVFRWMEEGETLTELTNFRLVILLMFVAFVAIMISLLFWQFLKAARYQRQLDELGFGTPG